MGVKIIVKIDDLPKTPKAFQQYVEDWFISDNVLGYDCMVASLFISCFDHKDHSRKHSGIAPGHSVDNLHYNEGLPSGITLNKWMEENKDKLIWFICTSEKQSYYGEYGLVQ